MNEKQTNYYDYLNGMQRAMILKARQARNEQAIELLMEGYSIEEVAEMLKEKDHERTEKE